MRRIDESIESLTPVAGVTRRRWPSGGVVGATSSERCWRTGSRRARGGAAAAPRPTSGSDELPDPERWLWRVEACRGAQTGVFDLCMEVDGTDDGSRPHRSTRPRALVPAAIHD